VNTNQDTMITPLEDLEAPDWEDSLLGFAVGICTGGGAALTGFALAMT